MTLKAEHYDNRGDDEVPFGFVYFNDGQRVGYAEVTETAPDGGVFTTGAAGARHLDLARRFLAENGVKGFADESTGGRNGESR